MLQSKIDRLKLLTEHHEKYSCSHEEKALRKRIVKNGAVQFVYQCTRCGEPTSSPLSKTKAYELYAGEEPPVFDNDLKEAWTKARYDGTSKIIEQDQTGFWESYSKYLASPEWVKKRKKVLKRSQGICEGCGEKEAAEVHHISYENVGNEFLFELVAICSECHDRIHPEND